MLNKVVYKKKNHATLRTWYVLYAWFLRHFLGWKSHEKFFNTPVRSWTDWIYNDYSQSSAFARAARIRRSRGSAVCREPVLFYSAVQPAASIFFVCFLHNRAAIFCTSSRGNRASGLNAYPSPPPPVHALGFQYYCCLRHPTMCSLWHEPSALITDKHYRIKEGKKKANKKKKDGGGNVRTSVKLPSLVVPTFFRPMTSTIHIYLLHHLLMPLLHSFSIILYMLLRLLLLLLIFNTTPAAVGLD